MILKYIDLFAGIGGLSYPFHSAQHKCVFTCEFNKFACQTYSANFGDTSPTDITTVNAETIPTHNILLAGFPCQPFSSDGLKLGFKDTRGTMFHYVYKIAKYHKPSVLLLENVKGLVSHDKGKTLSTIIHLLTDIGYAVTYKVLNAKDFGVPQNRERIYIVATLDRPFIFPIGPCTATKVGDILDDRVDPKYTISDKLWKGHQRRKASHRTKGNGFGYNIVTRDSQYTATISARYGKDGSEILIHQDKDQNPRKLTPKEALRLQGFQEGFILPVSDTQAYKQIGNSVAIPVVQSIYKSLIKHISK